MSQGERKRLVRSMDAAILDTLDRPNQGQDAEVQKAKELFDLAISRRGESKAVMTVQQGLFERLFDIFLDSATNAFLRRAIAVLLIELLKEKTDTKTQIKRLKEAKLGRVGSDILTRGDELSWIAAGLVAAAVSLGIDIETFGSVNIRWYELVRRYCEDPNVTAISGDMGDFFVVHSITSIVADVVNVKRAKGVVGLSSEYITYVQCLDDPGFETVDVPMDGRISTCHIHRMSTTGVNSSHAVLEISILGALWALLHNCGQKPADKIRIVFPTHDEAKAFQTRMMDQVKDNVAETSDGGFSSSAPQSRHTARSFDLPSRQRDDVVQQDVIVRQEPASKEITSSDRKRRSNIASQFEFNINSTATERANPVATQVYTKPVASPLALQAESGKKLQHFQQGLSKHTLPAKSSLRTRSPAPEDLVPPPSAQPGTKIRTLPMKKPEVAATSDSSDNATPSDRNRGNRHETVDVHGRTPSGKLVKPKTPMHPVAIPPVIHPKQAQARRLTQKGGLNRTPLSKIDANEKVARSPATDVLKDAEAEDSMYDIESVLGDDQTVTARAPTKGRASKSTVKQNRSKKSTGAAGPSQKRLTTECKRTSAAKGRKRPAVTPIRRRQPGRNARDAVKTYSDAVNSAPAGVDNIEKSQTDAIINEEAIRKPVIIGFTPKGPLNQGMQSLQSIGKVHVAKMSKPIEEADSGGDFQLHSAVGAPPKFGDITNKASRSTNITTEQVEASIRPSQMMTTIQTRNLASQKRPSAELEGTPLAKKFKRDGPKAVSALKTHVSQGKKVEPEIPQPVRIHQNGASEYVEEGVEADSEFLQINQPDEEVLQGSQMSARVDINGSPHPTGTRFEVQRDTPQLHGNDKIASDTRLGEETIAQPVFKPLSGETSTASAPLAKTSKKPHTVPCAANTKFHTKIADATSARQVPGSMLPESRAPTAEMAASSTSIAASVKKQDSSRDIEASQISNRDVVVAGRERQSGPTLQDTVIDLTQVESPSPEPESESDSSNEGSLPDDESQVSAKPPVAGHFLEQIEAAIPRPQSDPVAVNTKDADWNEGDTTLVNVPEPTTHNTDIADDITADSSSTSSTGTSSTSCSETSENNSDSGDVSQESTRMSLSHAETQGPLEPHLDALLQAMSIACTGLVLNLRAQELSMRQAIEEYHKGGLRLIFKMNDTHSKDFAHFQTYVSNKRQKVGKYLGGISSQVLQREQSARELRSKLKSLKGNKTSTLTALAGAKQLLQKFDS